MYPPAHFREKDGYPWKPCACSLSGTFLLPEPNHFLACLYTFSTRVSLNSVWFHCGCLWTLYKQNHTWYIFCHFFHLLLLSWVSCTPVCALHVRHIGNVMLHLGVNSFPVRLSQRDARFGRRPGPGSPSQTELTSTPPVCLQDHKLSHVSLVLGRGRWDCPSPLLLLL